ncbi:protein of unknown function [Pseudomonas mediterranea]
MHPIMRVDVQVILGSAFEAVADQHAELLPTILRILKMLVRFRAELSRYLQRSRIF